MKLSGDAKELCSKVYKQIPKDHGGLVEIVIDRAEAKVLRLAMIYALLDDSVTITLNHLINALSFRNYCEDSAKFIFSGREKNNYNQAILDSLKDGPKLKNRFFEFFKNKIRKEIINDTLRDLIVTGKRISVEIGTERRP